MSADTPSGNTCTLLMYWYFPKSRVMATSLFATSRFPSASETFIGEGEALVCSSCLSTNLSEMKFRVAPLSTRARAMVCIVVRLRVESPWKVVSYIIAWCDDVSLFGGARRLLQGGMATLSSAPLLSTTLRKQSRFSGGSVAGWGPVSKSSD
jgi:hypothetical protein